jgi:solute carrier family 25 carnitine/acylcarnitine transporter 20/29
MSFDTFIAGYAYGTTAVLVGQPFDTIKTRMQALGSSSGAVSTARSVILADGFRGLYRGGLPLIIGGGLMRSAQFGVYENILFLQNTRFGFTRAEDRFCGIIDPKIVLAGLAGGIGRGLVEGPFDYIKTRRQVYKPWLFSELLTGSGATLMRNSFLFAAFVIYMDLSDMVLPGGLGHFVSGAICSNLAWLSIWPMDVVKSQMQSGNFRGQSFISLLRNNFTSGSMFRGIWPGLVRSSISNGCSMVVYKKVLEALKEKRKDENDTKTSII